MNVPTDRRAVVKVLLRLRPPATASTRVIGGYNVMIIREAIRADWPAFEPGDVEGLVWTTPRQVDQVRRNLAGQPGVVATFGEGDPSP